MEFEAGSCVAVLVELPASDPEPASLAAVDIENEATMRIATISRLAFRPLSIPIRASPRVLNVSEKRCRKCTTSE